MVTASGSPSELDLLAELSDLSRDDDRELFAWRHPRMLEPGVAERLTPLVAGALPDARARMSRALAYLWDVRRRYEEEGVGFPIGIGPIEAVWEDVAAGGISMSEGEIRVRTPAFTTALSPRYLLSMARWTGAQAPRSGWRRNLQILRLVRAAAEAADPAVATLDVRVALAVAWADVAKVGLADIPDGGLLAESRALCEAALAGVGPDGDPAVRASLYFGLGTLFLDPYFAGATTGHIEDRATAWLHRGAIASDRITEQVLEMPEPLEALDVAETYLRHSLALRSPGRRAATLKALADLLHWRHELAPESDPRELGDLCREAIADLGDDPQPRLRLSLLNHLQVLGEQVDVDAVTPVLDGPEGDLIDEYGTQGAAVMLLTAIRLIGPTLPRTALDAVKRLRPVFNGSTDDLRVSSIEVELTALADSLVGQLPTEGSLSADVRAMEGRAGREGWNGARRAAAMLRLAGRASNTDEEALGLELIAKIPETSPIIAAEHWQLLAWVRTTLQLNMGVNAFRVEHWAECADWYAQALSGFMDLGMDERGLDTLLRVGDIVTRAESAIEVPFLRALAPNAARIETRLGDGATEVIQAMVNDALISMSDQPATAEAMNLLWQIAKGARLAPVLAGGTGYDPTTDDTGIRLLSRIAALRAETGAEPGLSGRDPDVLLDEETVLTAYARRRAVEGGATLEEQIANLEHAYDEHLTRQMLLSPDVAPAAYLSLKDVQATLSDRTVLVSLYVGAAPDGRMAVYALYLTDQTVGVSVVPHDFPSSRIEMGGLVTNPFGLLVEHVRRAVLDPPLGRRVVSRDGEELLETCLPGLLGHVSERLAEFRATGRDHLCIVPHGPFHFFPFHLLGPAGHPLAQDFTVTYLPHLYLIAERVAPAHRGRLGTAIGLSFADDHRPGLPPLTEAAPEAQDIAALFGRPPLIDERATEPAVVGALSSSAVVHLATHGRHNVDAPAFQTLYLHPTSDTDGRLHAYELLGLDLSGLLLLTLSACETALGRFDAGDNIRGLPACFFIGGVRSMIGTLWTVPDPVSRHFFTTFHRSHLAGFSLLDAFVLAQRETRAQYPQYRDWGAFTFAGDWVERVVDHREES